MLQDQTKLVIKERLKSAINSNEFAGANIMVLESGKEIFYHESGLANIEKKQPIERNSLFRLYSLTKPVTAAAVLILVERGLIDLFDPVNHFLTGFNNQKVLEDGKLVDIKREVNIKDLLNMTSGLLYPSLDQAGKYVDMVFKDLDKRLLSTDPMSTLEFANRIGENPLAFHPGEEWAYGSSADILGAIIEVVSGIKFGDFLNSEIFLPLGMNDTGFYVPREHINRLVKTYETTPNNGLKLYADNNLGIINSMDRPPAFESGGAGLVSTIDDYAKFTSMLINYGKFGDVRLLKPNSVEFLTSQILTEEQSKNYKEWHTLSGYSYGNLMRVMVNPELCGGLARQGEYGWDGWLGCYMANFPQEKLTILIMMQKRDGGTTSFTRKIRNIILSSLPH